MKTPPFLISWALLFWGWQTELIFFALPLIAILEASLLVKDKWDFSEADFNHVTDLCAVIFISIYIYNAIDNTNRAVSIVLELMPCIAFPLLIAQEYSVKRTIDVRSLFSFIRKSSQVQQLNKSVNLSFPYLILCLLAAGAANVTDGSYFIGVLTIGCWALYSIRTRRFPVWIVALLMILSGAFSFIGFNGLSLLQKNITEMAHGLFTGSQDPFKSKTAIGDIGLQKMHNYIIFRVKTDPLEALPILLREASYNVYKSESWYAGNADLKDVTKQKHVSSWQLSRHTVEDGQVLTVQQYLKHGMGMLKLPLGTYQIDDVEIKSLKKNHLGAVKVDKGRGLISYQVHYRNDQSFDRQPDVYDFKCPDLELPAIHQIIDELQLHSLSDRKIINRLKVYFDQEFGYTLDHQGKGDRDTPLAHFLLDRRAGHCELFATATTLILRECGIPARYAVGYSANEYSSFEEQIVVRHRHDHAWTLVYINGKWENLDTTSSQWMFFENELISAFSYIGDIFSYLGLKISSLDFSNQRVLTIIAFILILILVALMVGRLKNKKKTKRVKMSKNTDSVTLTKKGMESSFYLLQDLLEGSGYIRYQGESLSDWSARIQQAAPDLIDYHKFNQVIHNHYSLRFSPVESTQKQYSELALLVNQLIADVEPRLQNNTR